MRINMPEKSRAVAGGLMACLVAAMACDSYRHSLLDAATPDIISPSTVTTPEAADALRIGALGRIRTITAGGEGAWILGALLTDEWKSSDTFSQRNETDQRTIQESNANVQGFYTTLGQSRESAREAVNALTQYKPSPAWGVAQMWWAMGLSEFTLAETFCNGIPLGQSDTGIPLSGPPLTVLQVDSAAVAHYDSALTLLTATDATTQTVKTTVLISKARALIALGKFSDAATLVNGIATSFANTVVTYSLTSGDNQVWSLNNSAKRWTVGDSFDATGIIKNAIPFASANDPRVRVAGTTGGTSSQGRGFDGSTNLVVQKIWGRSDPVNLVSGLDARLIEAEARLQANDIPGMMTILNALRAAPPQLGIVTTSGEPAATSGPFTPAAMAALPAPATQDAAVTLFFREKAFWQFGRGFRLGDLRRLVRQYGRTNENVFPTGTFFKTTSPYGTDMNFPVTTNEYGNPLFHGCIDRKA